MFEKKNLFRSFSTRFFDKKTTLLNVCLTLILTKTIFVSGSVEK